MTLQYFTYFIDNLTTVDMLVFWIELNWIELNWIEKTLYNLCVINVSEQQNVMTIFKWRHKTEINLTFKR